MTSSHLIENVDVDVHCDLRDKTHKEVLQAFISCT
jgi:hypothetical protein